MDVLNFIKEIAEIITFVAGALAGFFGGKKSQEKKEKQYLRDYVEKDIIQELEQIKKRRQQQDGLNT